MMMYLHAVHYRGCDKRKLNVMKCTEYFYCFKFAVRA